MTKCSVERTRNRSAGSIGPAARAESDARRSNAHAMAAVSARATAPGSARLRIRAGRATGGTRENDAEDQRGNAKKTGPDEEESVSFEERAARRQALDHHARK